MISKLAKNIARFFVKQNIAESRNEAIYAYGMELLISDVLNGLLALIIALVSGKLFPVLVLFTVFMILRRFSGGYHADTHCGCILTMVVVMLIYCYGICNLPTGIIWFVNIAFITFSGICIFLLSPVAHPNKPVSEEKGRKLKVKSRIAYILFVIAVMTLYAVKIPTVSLYVASGIMLSAAAVLAGHISENRRVCDETVES